MTKQITASTTDNHEILIELRESVGSLAANVNGVSNALSDFIKAQQVENAKIHGRIEKTNESIADRGKITWPMIATLVSSLALIGGIGTAYVTLATGPLTTAMLANAKEIGNAENERRDMQDRLVSLNVTSAVNDATLAEYKRWAEKLQDEIRHKVSLPATP